MPSVNNKDISEYPVQMQAKNAARKTKAASQPVRLTVRNIAMQKEPTDRRTVVRLECMGSRSYGQTLMVNA
jgi:hypothetical protein